ncbi:sortase [Alkalihalobacillus alcalophilus ATCC 27647 = CGMCC 1.3604]|uniref:Sortase n=1 Tax=Alkalihalobacillus alcalophilus ATCC 27647 = CGMCC 1.3604 TaxID=1218173 RepID=A0A094WPD0_ALKAL|nr:class D sortase [Alkalihalobacillus alcalophilus]KGA98676.1 sortase [Alkalihalobacillus alcalophilus ATCC 27647 = CGMCC 1.3604]MED1560300.1 class D sortase [Alkalihalobacillus alcalophilus]THG88622.1 sortase [Alkalihalobacillus alcalophilus ATCC 27647 = CGMCC 1.3604]
MRFIASLIMIVGLAFLIYGGYEIFQSSQKQKQSLAEANEVLAMDRDVENPISSAESMDINDGDVIGLLTIPKLEKDLPIISGTEEEELERGVGHYKTTKLPGQNDQILLSGHRDSVFRGFGELEIGDQFIVEMPYGTFVYEMYESEIVPADDTTVIRSMAPDEVLTLSTCYPFNFVGSAPDRYIIYAKPVVE